MNEQTTDDGWVLYDAGSAVTVCPHGFQEELDTRHENGRPRCEAATGNAVILGGEGAREEREYELQFLFQSCAMSPNLSCRLTDSSKQDVQL